MVYMCIIAQIYSKKNYRDSRTDNDNVNNSHCSIYTYMHAYTIYRYTIFIRRLVKFICSRAAIFHMYSLIYWMRMLHKISNLCKIQCVLSSEWRPDITCLMRCINKNGTMCIYAYKGIVPSAACTFGCLLTCPHTRCK